MDTKRTLPTRAPNPKAEGVTWDKLSTFFEDMKDFVKSTAKGTETVLRNEMQTLKSELKGEMQELKSELKGDMQALKSELKSDITAIHKQMKLFQMELFEHGRGIKQLRTDMQAGEQRLSEKIDTIGARTENHETRIAKLEHVVVEQ